MSLIIEDEEWEDEDDEEEEMPPVWDNDTWDITDEYEEYPCKPVSKWNECKHFVENHNGNCKYVIWKHRDDDVRFCRIGQKLKNKELHNNAKNTAETIIADLLDDIDI